MPLFMDVHHKVEGLTAKVVAGAHGADLDVQQQYGINYPRYWFDEDSSKVSYLVEALDAKTAMRVHKEAHGLVADDITMVQEGT